MQTDRPQNTDKGRILGLDYGSTTVGVAITDGLGLTAQPLETITRSEENKLRRTLARISQLVIEKGVTQIALGLPIKLDGEEGERAAATREFADKLSKRVGVPIAFVDERLTTVEADSILDETGFTKDRIARKQVIDQLAAQLILEEYMQQTESEAPQTLEGEDK